MNLTANFSETSQTALSASVPESGGSWIDCGSTAVSPQIFPILGGILGPGGSGLGLYRYSGIAASADTVVSAIFNYQSSVFNSVGILARMNAAGTSGYLAAYVQSVSKWEIFRVEVGQTTTTLALSAVITHAANDTPSIDFDVSGSGASVALVLKIGGVAVVTTTDTSASRVVAAGYPGVWFSSAAAGGGQGMFIERMSSADAVVTDSAIFTTLTGKIYPLSGGITGTAALAVAGTYTGTPPDQWRLVLDGGSSSVTGFDWQAFSTTPSAGSFAQTATAVPKIAGWYNMQVRNSAVPATVFTTGKLGAGAFIVVDGQSNAWLWFSSDARGGDGTLTPDPLVRVTGKQASNAWAVPSATMNAAIACGNALVAAIGCPLGIIDGSWDASGLTVAGGSGGSGPNGQWVPTSTNAYGSSLSAITAAGGKVIGNIWIQGEADAGAGVSQATYYNALGVMIAQRRTDLSAATLPYVMVTLARDTVGMADANRESIKLAQVQKCADTNVYRVDRLDLPLSDGVHHNATGFTALGKRVAQAILASLGLASQYRGPSIASVVEVSAMVFDVTLTHHLGSDFTPSSAITGFRVTDPGAADAVIAVSSAVRQSAGVVRLTLASDPVAAPKVAYLWGSTPTITGVALDNSALTLPLEYNAGVVAAATDTTAPTMNGSIAVSAITSSGFTLTWSAASDAVGVTGYKLSLDNGATYPYDLGNVLTTSRTGLAASTLYNIKIGAYDAAANFSVTPLSTTATTSAASDTTAPVMVGSIAITAITSSGFTASWSAATDAVGVVAYEFSTDNGTSYTNIGNVLTYSPTGLAASTLFNVKVRALDAVPNRATPLSTTATTSASSDVTAPVLSGVITISAITTGGFTAAWNAATDAVGVTGYEISVDAGTPAYTSVGNVLTTTKTALSSATLYNVRVRAFDAAGNRSTAITTTVTTATPTTFATSVTLTFQDRLGVLRANLTGMKWAFFDQATPDSLGIPSAKGTLATTNSSGVATLNITGTQLAPGAIGWLIFSNSDGTATQSNLLSFAGPCVTA